MVHCGSKQASGVSVKLRLLRIKLDGLGVLRVEQVRDEIVVFLHWAVDSRLESTVLTVFSFNCNIIDILLDNKCYHLHA